MKLNVSEYRWILLNCNIMAGLYKGKQYAVIEPKFPKYQAKLDRLLGSITFPSIEEWNRLSRELKPKLKETGRLRHEQAVRKLAGMSNSRLATLNNKQRIELLDGLLQDVIGRDLETFEQNRQTVSAYGDQLKILLFGIRLPEEFLRQEQARCEQFCHRLQSVPRLKEDLENWFELEFRLQRALAENIIKAFNDTYQTQIGLRFFGESEWYRAQAEKNAAPVGKTAPAAYAEALRVARQQEDWSHFPLIDKLFENKFAYLALEGNDLYGMNPVEHHAYRMDEAVAGFLLDKMQIKFIENDCPPADAFPRFAGKNIFSRSEKTADIDKQ
mgnify:CR=1 FL=1